MGLARLEPVDRSRVIDHLSARDEDSFSHAARVNISYGQLGEVLNWLKGSLHDEWRWQMISFPGAANNNLGEYIFYFDNEKDYMVFCLKYVK